MENVLDLSHEVSSQMLQQEIANGFSWRRSTIDPGESIIRINESTLRKLIDFSASISSFPSNHEDLYPDQLDAPELFTIMNKVKKLIDHGPGFAVIDALPLKYIGREEAINLFWLLGKGVGRPVAQKWDETMLYEVHDSGQQYGYGVRGSYTNVELCFHNDNAFNTAVPRVVGLLCINPAKLGGASRFCSFYSVHNELLEKHPKALARLYEPIYWDRQKEHADGEPIAAYAPIFRWEKNQLHVRANVSLNRKGYSILGLDIDTRTEDALCIFEECLSNPEFWVELPLESGELQYLNNQEIAHYRSEFEDHDEPLKKRLLIRTWHREQGTIHYNG